MLENGKRFEVNSPNVVSELMDGEVVIVNLEVGAYFSFDGAGAEIWRCLELGMSLRETAEWLANEYNEESMPPGIVNEVAGQMLEEALIRPVEGTKTFTEPPHGSDQRPFVNPTLHKYTDMEELLQLDPIHDVDDMGWPTAKPNAKA